MGQWPGSGSDFLDPLGLFLFFLEDARAGLGRVRGLDAREPRALVLIGLLLDDARCKSEQSHRQHERAHKYRVPGRVAAVFVSHQAIVTLRTSGDWNNRWQGCVMPARELR